MSVKRGKPLSTRDGFEKRVLDIIDNPENMLHHARREYWAHQIALIAEQAFVQRGREDAAKAVRNYYDTDHNGMADGCDCRLCIVQRLAIAAARGDGERE